MTDDEYKLAVDKIIHHVSVGLIPFVPPKGEPDLRAIANLLAILVHRAEEPFPTWESDPYWGLVFELGAGFLNAEVGISRRLNLDRWLELVKYDRGMLLHAAADARRIVESLQKAAK